MTTSSKYDLRLNPPYVVDFSVAASGKRMGATKKKVQFRFGFSNAEALADGLTGIHCRGEEHEVNLTWSLMSGKRTVSFDGKEIHYSMGSRTETQFDTSWSMVGGHVIKLVAHAAMPIREIPGFRQYDLMIDGMSVFDMPKIYELGTGRVPPLGRSSQGYGYGGGSSYRAPDTYENAWARQPVESYQPQSYQPERSVPRQRSVPRIVEAPRQTQPEAPPPAQAPAPPAAVDLIAQPVATNDHLATPMVDITPTVYAPPPAPVVDEFAPVVPVQTYDNKMDNILAQYGPSAAGPSTPSKPGLLALTNGQDAGMVATTPNTMMSTPTNATPYAVPPQAPSQPPPPPEQQFFADPRSTPEPTYEDTALEPVRLSMNELSPTTVVQTMEAEKKNDLQKAMSNLVNLDDITEPAPEQYNKLTMEKEERERQQMGKKSKPLPPQTSYLGSGATLSDIKNHVGQHKAPPKQEVMRTHAFDPSAAQAGMMVVYGQQQVTFQQGFGAGATLSTYDAFGRPFAAH